MIKMKKMHVGIILAVAATLIILGAFAYVNATEPKISKEEAMRIAEEATGGTATSIDVEREFGSIVYEVHVTNETGDWEVEIDAYDGTVLEIEPDDYDIEENEDDDDEEDDDD